VQVLLLEKEQQHLDKTQNWRRKIDPLMMWISSAETRLNTHFEIAPDLDTDKKQKRELEVHFSHSFLTGFFSRGYAVFCRRRHSKNLKF